jgi:hypothetical protein
MPYQSIKLISNFNKEVAYYLAELEKYSDEDLNKKPGDGGWTLGQVYNH